MRRKSADDQTRASPPSLAAAGPISYAIVRLAKAHKAIAAGLLRKIGLYPGQELVLMHLCDEDERTQAELVRALNVDASTVARMVSRLERQRIVHREGSTRDRRAVIVSLTPRGVDLCEEVRLMWTELEATTTTGMSAPERDELFQALQNAAHRLPVQGD
ncbi:MAG: MarR family winged helix-turn-helix transcriptional regulator [Thermomicrobiales bacterium]